jgi:protein SCO1/2/putative membrane protein
MDVYSLPTVNATLNAISAVLLVIAYLEIRKGNRERHRKIMLTAFGCSAAFLICYLTYHGLLMWKGLPPSVPFGHEGTTIRTVYLAILLTHTVLAATVPVLAIITMRRAFAAKFPAHRQIAKWTLPIWLYVNVTGVVVYWMLYQL